MFLVWVFLLLIGLPIVIWIYTKLYKKVKSIEINEDRNNKAKRIAVWIWGMVGFLVLIYWTLYTFIDD